MKSVISFKIRFQCFINKFEEGFNNDEILSVGSSQLDTSGFSDWFGLCIFVGV